jgi:hypothetical protein
MVQIGILLALACALATNVAVLCKYKGARAAAAVDFRRPLRSAGDLFRSRWWTIGFTVAFGAWILHVAALALAPISLVETVISGGLVLLAWFAGRWFGLRVGPREWLGLGLCAAGLALLGATSVGAAGGASAGYSSSAMIVFEAAAVGIGAMLLVSGTIGSTRAGSGTLLGVAAGLLFGVANVSIKALTGTVPSDLLSIVSPWTLVALLAGIASFFALARGLQIGDAIPVITLASVTANLGSVTGGILVFGDSMGDDPLDIVARCLAFAAVIAAAAMMPAHGRAAAAHA